jgi:hypothetical protein
MKVAQNRVLMAVFGISGIDPSGFSNRVNSLFDCLFIVQYSLWAWANPRQILFRLASLVVEIRTQNLSKEC